MNSFVNSNNINEYSASTIIPYIPYNKGYMINGRKIYGQQDQIENGTSMTLISPDNHIHIWTRREYVEKKMNEKDTEYDALFESSPRYIVSNRDMIPCPSELHNSGICLERNNPDHRKYFYHFTKYDRDGNIVMYDNMVLCRYKKKGKWYCWENHNNEHNNVFTHL